MSDELNVDEKMLDGMGEMELALEHLQSELSKIRAGKASASMLSSIMVDYYGTLTPLMQVSNVGTADSRTITIQPWEKNMLGHIERAIFEANLGLTPMNDGEFVRINIPPMTEERRIQLVKQTKTHGEDARISVRSARQKLIEFIKKEVKDGYPEDAGKRKEEEVEVMMKSFYKKVDTLLEAKEKDVMTV